MITLKEVIFLLDFVLVVAQFQVQYDQYFLGFWYYTYLFHETLGGRTEKSEKKNIGHVTQTTQTHDNELIADMQNIYFLLMLDLSRETKKQENNCLFTISQGEQHWSKESSNINIVLCRLQIFCTIAIRTHITAMLNSYRNQAISLQCKSIDWFVKHQVDV